MLITYLRLNIYIIYYISYTEYYNWLEYINLYTNYIYIYNHIDLFSIVYKQSDCSYIICETRLYYCYTYSRALFFP